MSAMGFGRMPAIMWPSDREQLAELRADYANRVYAYELGDFMSTHAALESAVAYIEELERWVGPGSVDAKSEGSKPNA